MTTPEFVFFDTAIGRSAVAWGQHGLLGVWLPEPDQAQARRKVLSQLPTATGSAPPAAVRAGIEAMIRLLDGQPDELADIVLDETGVPDFNRKVYLITRAIPAGSTLCYGDIAVRLGQPGSARAVGRALGNNPWPIVVPCHRVLAADGTLHGFSAHGGIDTKRRMLQIEGALPADEPTLF